MPDFKEKYGLRFPKDANDLMIELSCYRDPVTFPTGKSREFHFKNAWRLVWPNFLWNDWMEMEVWAWCNYRLVGIVGHTRASKSYGMAHISLLDYFAADSLTATSFTTTKFDALKTRMWGDLMRALETVSPSVNEYIKQRYRVTSTSNEMKFFINTPGLRATDKFMIQGVATDSADTSAGKLRGQHADRRRIIVDEAQDVADAIYMAFLNAMSAPDFVGALLTNPVDKMTKLGEWVKPKNGWGSIHDTDLFWETEKPNGICLHFDGLQSPNIKAGKVIFPFMLTQSYVDDVRKTSGEDSREWWMYIRGFFPPDGMVSKVWPSTTLEKAKPGYVFDMQPEGFAVLDPAFEHDDCVLHFGNFGRDRSMRQVGSFTETVKIVTKVGQDAEPKDYQIARQVKKLCLERGVKPESYIQDETGNGRGVLAILRMEWSQKCQGVNFGGEASDRPLRLNDPKPANELVKHFVSELWFRASYLANDGVICGIGNLDPKTVDDLNSRRYEVKNKLMVVEDKVSMKKRLGRSPDYGDAAVLVGELMVRKGMLKGVGGKGAKDRWDAAKNLAKKAAARFDTEKEFAYG